MIRPNATRGGARSAKVDVVTPFRDVHHARRAGDITSPRLLTTNATSNGAVSLLMERSRSSPASPTPTIIATGGVLNADGSSP